MTFLFKIAYYAALCVCSLAGVFYIVVGLFDSKPGSNQSRERIFLLIAAVVALGLLYRAFRLGHQQEQWGAGLTMIVGAIIAFIVIMLVGIFTGKIHWQ